MPGRPLVRRRTLLTGAAGAAAFLATGCDHGDDIGGSFTPSPSASQSTASSSSAPAKTPDEALVDQVVEELRSALTVVIGAAEVPTLRTAMHPLLKVHRKHLAVLDSEPAARTGVGRPEAPRDALHHVRQSETLLQAGLVDAATRAESGALAKLLASMSASVTQYLHVLPSQAPAQATP